jgi:hypothetical protein
MKVNEMPTVTPPIAAALPQRIAFLDAAELFVSAPTTRFIPGSPIARMHDAAARGDVDTLRVQLVAMRADMVQLRAASESPDVETIIKILERIGVDAARLAADATAYVRLAIAAINLLNGVLGIANVFLNSDKEVATGVLVGDDAGVQLAVVSLQADVAKENKGFVLFDNVEAIRRAEVTFTVEQGPPATQLLLTVTLRALGVGQDTMTAPLRLIRGDGAGSPTPAAPILNTVDAAGVQINQISTFTRAGTTSLTIGLDPAPGSIDYGINGANLALVLEASGVATFPNGIVQLPTVQAIDLGLSV